MNRFAVPWRFQWWTVSDTASPLPETLLAHATFVRGLARAALRGDPECEDVEQDAWLAAVRGLPAEPERQRGWLARIVRNRAIDVFRRRRRRAQREREAARPESLPPVDEAVARAETGRRVVDAVLSLEPPYRGVILLRFFDGLPPRRVAERLGLPVETVRTHVRRGLERLRERLGVRPGAREDRRVRALVLLAATAGGEVMTKKIAVAALTLLLLGGGTWLVVGRAGPDDDATATLPGDGPPSVASAAPEVPTLAKGTIPPALPASAPAPVETVVEGVVVDEAGAPVAGAVVWRAREHQSQFILSAPPPSEEAPLIRAEPTGTDGRFRLRIPGWVYGNVGLQARAPGMVLSRRPGDAGAPAYVPTGSGARIVMQRGVALRVRVVTRNDGGAVAGARVAAYGFAGYLLHTSQAIDEGTTSAAGEASLLVAAGDVRVVAEAAGLAQTEVSVRATPPSAEATVALPVGGVVRGIVFDPAHRPFAGARVTLLRAPRFRAQATTDTLGRFHFEQVPPAPRVREPIDGRRVVVLACDAEGYGRQYRSAEPPEAGGEAEVLFALAELANVEVLVRNARGLPVPDLPVAYGAVESRPEWGWTSYSTTREKTDALGSFLAKGLAPGRVALWAPYVLGGEREPRYVDVPMAGPIELTITTTLVERKVRVRDAAGVPVVRAIVRAWTPHWGADEIGGGSSKGTDTDGRTTTSVPEAGPFTLVVDAPGGALVAIPFTDSPKDDEIDLRLGSGRVEGRVVGLDGAPRRVRVQPGVGLKAPAVSVLVSGWRSAIDTDADGRFAFDRLASPIQVTLATEGMTLLERGQYPPGAPPVTLHALTSTEAACLTPAAEVVDSVSGAPLGNNVRVVARDPTGGRSETLYWIGLAGEHRTDHPLPAGDWTLRAEAAGYEPAEVRVTLAASGAPPRPRLALRPR